MPQQPFLQSGVSFQDGNTYPASSLTNAVNNATLLSTIITQWAQKSTPVAADRLLLYDSVANALKNCTIASIQGASYVFYGGTDSGTANTYIVNVSPTPTAYSSGTIFVFLASNANTGASTFNANGLGAVDIQFNGAALVANQILAGGYYVLGYSGSKFEILNPSITALPNSALATMTAGTIKANSGTTTTTPSDITCTASGFALMAATSTASQVSLLGALSHIKTGYTSYDISTASGTQTISGIGFQPKAVIIFSNLQSNTFTASWGMDNGTTAGCIYCYATGGNSFAFATNIIELIITNAVTYSTATVSAFNADGFNLTWVKTGSPTGTANIFYMAIG